MKPFTGKVLAQYAAADRSALQPLLLHRGLELLYRQVGVLQTERGKSRKAVRPRGADFRKLLVVDLDDLSSYVAILAIPRRIDRQHLHVDRHGVHALEPVLDGVSDEMLLRAFGFGDHVGRLVTHQRERFVEQAVRMDVDGFDPLAFDPHRQAPATSLRVHRVQHPATAEHDTRRALEKVSSCGHVDVSPRKISFDFLLWFLAYVLNANIHCAGTSPFSFSTPTASTNCVQRAMSFSTNFRNSAGF
jgi:hypothetical protein